MFGNNDETLSFINEYHAGENNDILKDFNEHMEFTNSTKKGYSTNDMNVTTNTTKNFITDNILSEPEDMLRNRFSRFNRYGYLDPAHEFVSGAKEYLFFSKPDLNLIIPGKPDKTNPQLSNVPFFDEAFKRYKLSYYSLQQTFGENVRTLNTDGMVIDLNNKYINLLSNMVTSSFDLSDITAGDVTNNQNLYQINTSYREGSLPSDLQYDFSLEFKDTKYLDVYMLFKIYDEYFRQKYMYEITPVRFEYIFNKIYPEALSIWKIIVDDTGRIMYWAKATGCTPMSVPRGTISNIENTIKFTVNWKAQFIRDMDPVNLAELNYLTASSIGVQTGPDFMKRLMQKIKLLPNVMPGYGNSGDMVEQNNSTWVRYPLILMGPVDKNVMNLPVRTGHHTTVSTNAFHRLVWVDI